MSNRLCFCTLAVGKRYRAHARLLAQDIQRYAPGMSLVVLTDRPTEFEDFPLVVAHKHHLRSVLGYHDKLHVIETAIATFETCLFLDSDVRILGPVPTDLNFPPGLTARFGCSILKHNKHSKIRPALSLIEAAGQRFDLDLDNVIWLHECMFAVRRQNGLEKEFLHHWQVLSYYFQLNNIYDGEGNVMGLAAAASGLDTEFKREDVFPFFKDVIEKERIKKGESSLDINANWFQTHRQIEYPRRTFHEKATNKLRQQLSFSYRWTKLCAVALQNYVSCRTMQKLMG